MKEVEKKKSNILVTITESLNKHGVIKGKDKKQTKVLKAMCPHHKITKKGHVKGTFWNDGTGTCTCVQCGAKFPSHLYDDSELEKTVAKALALVNQAKMMNTAIGGGKEMESYLADLCVKLTTLPKSYRKIRHIAEANNGMKKNKKDKGQGNNINGSSLYGGWRS